MSPQVDFKGKPVIHKEPENNVRTTRYYGGYEEQPDGSEKWTTTVDEVNEWHCEYAEFDEEGLCHGCDGEKEGSGKCEAIGL